MTPIWTNLIFDAARRVMRICSYCKKASEYDQKRPGQFYKCHLCGHRFQEKKK